MKSIINLLEQQVSAYGASPMIDALLKTKPSENEMLTTIIIIASMKDLAKTCIKWVALPTYNSECPYQFYTVEEHKKLLETLPKFFKQLKEE